MNDPITLLKRARQEVFHLCDLDVAGTTEIKGWYNPIRNSYLSGRSMVRNCSYNSVRYNFASELIKEMPLNIVNTNAICYDSDVVYRGSIYRADIFEGIYLPDLSKIRKITIYSNTCGVYEHLHTTSTTITHKDTPTDHNCIIYEQLYPTSTTVTHIGGQVQYDVILIGNYGIPLDCMAYTNIYIEIYTTEEIDVNDFGIIYSFTDDIYIRKLVKSSLVCSFQKGRLCRIMGGLIENL